MDNYVKTSQPVDNYCKVCYKTTVNKHYDTSDISPYRAMWYTEYIVQVPIMARRVVSETNNEGPIPSPEALLLLGITMALLTFPAKFEIMV